MLDVVMTGEASQILGCDRRTFILWATKLKIAPAAIVNGKHLYLRKDVEKVEKAFKEKKKS